MNEIFVCTCYNTEHQLVISRNPLDEKEGPMIFINIYLKNMSWYKRLWYGIKYIFGYKCKYGAFDEFIMDSADADKLQGIVNYLKKVK